MRSTGGLRRAQGWGQGLPQGNRMYALGRAATVRERFAVRQTRSLTLAAPYMRLPWGLPCPVPVRTRGRASPAPTRRKSTKHERPRTGVRGRLRCLLLTRAHPAIRTPAAQAVAPAAAAAG